MRVDGGTFVKQAQAPGLAESGYVVATLEGRANRIYVTVNPDYYDRRLPKSAPQREIGSANLPEFRSMVK